MFPLKSTDLSVDFSGSTPLNLIDISRRQWFAINCAVQCIAIEAIMTFTIGFDTITIEVFICVVMSVCSIRTHMKNLEC